MRLHRLLFSNRCDATLFGFLSVSGLPSPQKQDERALPGGCGLACQDLITTPFSRGGPWATITGHHCPSFEKPFVFLRGRSPASGQVEKEEVPHCLRVSASGVLCAVGLPRVGVAPSRRCLARRTGQVSQQAGPSYRKNRTESNHTRRNPLRASCFALVSPQGLSCSPVRICAARTRKYGACSRSLGSASAPLQA
ncbi:hypothetical protein CCMA1212_002492 [Trichoderma ghanense]|uniref:Uncharacterized protein n=1 Tax=Trichoderma ghanense TaxID=65468 RepID=A0ABY2HBB9_9HYPO